MTTSSRIKVLAASLTLSVAGVLFIQQHEGTVHKAYLDPVGIPTICSGSTYKVRIGMTETAEGCTARLRLDTGIAGNAVASCVKSRITQGQYDALVSLTYNIGGGAFCRSTLVKKLNSGDCLGAANEFLKWNRAGGRVLPGLQTRRIAESEAFRHGC